MGRQDLGEPEGASGVMQAVQRPTQGGRIWGAPAVSADRPEAAQRDRTFVTQEGSLAWWWGWKEPLT